MSSSAVVTCLLREVLLNNLGCCGRHVAATTDPLADLSRRPRATNQRVLGASTVSSFPVGGIAIAATAVAAAAAAAAVAPRHNNRLRLHRHLCVCV